MVIALGYKQQRELGSGVNTPAVRPSVANTGVGEAIERAAGSAMTILARMEEQNAQSNATKAVSDTNVALEEAFQKSRLSAQPGAPNFTPDRLKEYDDEVERRAKELPDDVSRKVYRERMDAQRDNWASRSLGWEYQERVRNRVHQFEEAGEADANQLFMADSASRSVLYQDQQKAFDQAIENVELTPEARQKVKDDAKKRRGHAAVQADLRDRPDEVQDWVIGRGTGESGYYANLRQIESSGRDNLQADTSSAYGPYQFLKGTWAEVMRTHPELGLTEADRFDAKKQEIAIRAFTEDNIAVLNKAGIKPTPLNVYMAHFLGSVGAVKFLQANPQSLAAAHVSPEAVAANPTIFRAGRTVADVLGIFGKKWGDTSTMGGQAPSYYADLSPEQRDSYYSQAETEMNKRRVQGEAAFTQRVQSSIAEYGQNGTSVQAPSEAEFVAAYGPNRGTIAYGEFKANAQGAAAGHKLYTLPLNQHHDFVETFKPTEGDPFFAEKRAVYDRVKVQADTIRKQVTEDFGGFVTSRNTQARQFLADAFDLQKLPHEARTAAQNYAAIVRAEADRMNVPASNRSLLPKSRSDQVAAIMNQQLSSEGDAWGKVQMLTAFADRWGSMWPAVYGELKENLSAPVQVITSGVKDKAAVILATVHDKSYEELTKATMPKADKITLDESMQAAFQPFLNSTMWTASGRLLPGVGVFYEQAKKLAAVYVAQGNGASDAAEMAYQDLIGFKYRMIDARDMNIRVPVEADTLKEPGIFGENNYMESYLRAEKRRIIESGHIQPSAEDVKLYGEDGARRAMAASLEKNAKWVTLTTNNGVGLMVNGVLIRGSHGKDVALTWGEVMQNGPAWWASKPKERFENPLELR